MNWEQIGTMVGSFILGIGVVAAFVHKYVPLIKKYLGLATKTIVFLNEIVVAIDDSTISDAEWNQIKNDALALRNAWVAKAV